MSTIKTISASSKYDLVNSQLRQDLPNFSSGDTIRVDVKIQEGDKYRLQAYEGLVIKTQGKGITSSVTVRKMSNGVFVERTFPVHSPIIDKIEVIKRGRVRRSRIYYIRQLRGKAARIKEIHAKPAPAKPEVKEKKNGSKKSA
jgi:large subunit ribosomal protein L19